MHISPLLKINIYGIMKKVEITTVQYYNFYFQEGKEMSFCKYCGRQLQDGEICNCQQTQQPAGGAAQPQQEFNQQTFQQGVNQQAGQQTYQQGFNQQQASQQMAAVKQAGANAALDYVNILKGLFTSPVETVSAFVAKVNVIMIAILVGGQALINMLTRLFDMLIANGKAKVTTGSKELDSLLSAYTSYTKTKPYPAGEIFKNMLLEILLVAVAAALFALVVMLLAKAFNKANVTYLQGLAVYAVTSVLGIPAALLSWVTGLTSVGFIDRVSTCITVFSNVAGYAFVYMAIRALCKDEKKLPLIMAISYVAVNFVTWLVRLMF